MEVVFSDVDFSYACEELRDQYSRLLESIKRVICDTAITCKSEKTLGVVLGCPCCSINLSSFIVNNIVLISPLKGVDVDGHPISRLDKYPPLRGDDDECKTDDEFLTLIANLVKGIEL